MDSLLSFDGAADVLNNLINKISDAVGWVTTHSTPQREAVNTYIQEIQNSNYDPLTKAALVSNAKKLIREYTNQSEVIKNAVNALKPSAHPQLVDETWLSIFFDKTRFISDTDFQLIWGNILAEECNVPNSIPKGLLHILEHMDKEDASKFSKVCSVSVRFTGGKDFSYTPIILRGKKSAFYDDIGLNLDALLDLKAIGLIEFDPSSTAFSESPYSISAAGPEIRYFDETFRLPKGETTFDTGCVVYTRSGEALCKAITVEKIDGFFKNIVFLFGKTKVKLQCRAWIFCPAL